MNTLTTINPKFSKMVLTLTKPPEDILASMTPAKVNLLHMMIGFTGEVIELGQALAEQDCENIKEELFDCEFYLEGIRLSYGFTRMSPNYASCAAEAPDFCFLIDASERLLNLVKKHCVYNNELDLLQLQEIMTDCELCINTILILSDNNLDDVYEHGYDKLMKKRYPNGYTDEAAALRADKVEGE